MKLWLMVLCFFFAGATLCEAANLRARTPLIFIHGIKGAKLSSSKGKIMWLTLGQALSLDTPDLRLPLGLESRGQKFDTLSVAGPLDYLSIIPGVFRKSIYGKWIDQARALKRPFLSFSYDWRRDNLETVAQFENFVKLVYLQHGKRPVQLVAHSMGGLISLVVLNRHPEWFQSVVFVGVPFGGGVGFLPDLQEGVSNGFNRKILSPEVLATYPSVYSFFPKVSHQVKDDSQKEIPVNFFDAGDWQRYQLGPFAKGKMPADDFKTFFPFALKEALLFREEIQAKKIAYPPIAVVCSKSTPTLDVAVFTPPGQWDLKTAPQVEGDGRVSAQHCVPPEGVPFTQYWVNQEHAELLDDESIPKIVTQLEQAAH